MGIRVRSQGKWAATGSATSGAVAGAPTGVVAASTVPGTIDVTWTAPASSGTGPITSYSIVATSPGASPKSMTVGGSARSASISGVLGGATYTVTVSAVNGVGVGPASAPATVTVVAPATGTNFLLNPSAAGYPDATNTGYANYVDPALGRKLTAADLTTFTGLFTTSAPGQVIKNMHIVGHVKVAHPNVKFIGCWIDYQPTSSSNTFAVTDHKTGPSAPASDADIWSMSYCTITQSEFSLGSMNTTYANVDHCDFSGGTDAWDPFGIGSVEWYFNYLHHLVQNSATKSHCDIFQPVGGNGNVKFHHNTCLSYNPDTGFFGNTSIMQIGQLTGNITGVIDFYDNLCDGGNFMANANWASDTATPPLTLSGTIKIHDNRLGRHAQFGVHTHIPEGHDANFVIANNVFDDDNSLAW